MSHKLRHARDSLACVPFVVEGRVRTGGVKMEESLRKKENKRKKWKQSFINKAGKKSWSVKLENEKEKKKQQYISCTVTNSMMNIIIIYT